MKKTIYIAGPLFTIQDRKFLEQIRDWVKETGAKTFLPHEDNEDNAKNRTITTPALQLRSIFEKDISCIDDSDAIIALLDGVATDDGTLIEIGYAYAKGKPILGYRTDFRTLGNAETHVDLMVQNACTQFLFVPDGNLNILKEGIKDFVKNL